MTTRNLQPQAGKDRTSGARRAQSQTRAPRTTRTTRTPKPPLRLLKDMPLGDVLPPDLLAQLESECEASNHSAVEAVAVAVDEFLKRSQELREKEGGATPLITTAAASTFCAILKGVRALPFDEAISELQGLLGLLEGNPAFAVERYALRMICSGDHLLWWGPAVDHHRESFGAEGTAAYRSCVGSFSPEAIERDLAGCRPVVEFIIEDSEQGNELPVCGRANAAA